ncbi:MAG TPA: flavin reductase family protein [Syntrophorhabdus sp.]|nr:flavin reductase family protein [Syntrophorhabdus sp.]
MKRSLGAKSLLYPTPIVVVGTYDNDGRANAMTVAWVGIVCSQPPCIGVSLRKATYTYGNIIEKEAFTISIPTEKHVKEVDYLGIASGRREDKFSTSGLTPIRSDIVDAPYVKEFPFILECQLIQTIEIGLHTQFVGEIKNIKADESILNEKDLPDMGGRFKPLLYAPELRKYFGMGPVLGNAFSMGKEM